MISVSALFLFFCFYLTLNFIEITIKGKEDEADERDAEKIKKTALICFAIALAAPIVSILF